MAARSTFYFFLQAHDGALLGIPVDERCIYKLSAKLGVGPEAKQVEKSTLNFALVSDKSRSITKEKISSGLSLSFNEIMR